MLKGPPLIPGVVLRQAASHLSSFWSPRGLRCHLKAGPRDIPAPELPPRTEASFRETTAVAGAPCLPQWRALNLPVSWEEERKIARTPDMDRPRPGLLTLFSLCSSCSQKEHPSPSKAPLGSHGLCCSHSLLNCPLIPSAA